MFQYKDGAIKICQFEDAPIEEDIFADQKASYREYLRETVKLDVNYLCYLLSTVICKGNKDVKADVTVGKLVPSEIIRESDEPQPKYYPVYVTFYTETAFGKTPIIKDELLLKIPYMDEYCVLNVNGKHRTLINEMVRYEDISFNQVKKEVDIVTKYSFLSMKLADGGRNMTVNFRKKSISIDSLLHAFCSHYNVNLNYSTLFSNHYIRRAIYAEKHKPDATLDGQVAKLRILYNLIPNFRGSKSYSSDDTGKLGHLRDSLNKRLSLRSCLDQILSRDISDATAYHYTSGTVVTQEMINILSENNVKEVKVKSFTGDPMVLPVNDALDFELYSDLGNTGTFNIPAGTKVTEAVLKDIYRHQVNAVYVKAIPDITAQSLATGIQLQVIPKGAIITDYLRKIVPELNDSIETVTKKDYQVNFAIDRDTKLTRDILQLLCDCGYKSVQVSVVTHKKKGIIEYPFEQEFIGNYTARARDLMDPMSLPEGIDGDDWIYYNVPDIKALKEPNCSEYFTVWDIVGLISLSARLLDGDKYGEALNADLDFSKRINQFNEIYSAGFRKVASVFCHTTARHHLLDIFNQGGRRSKNIDPFLSFSDSILSQLRSEKYLRDSKDQTPVAIITQANKIMTKVKDARTVSGGQRMLALGYLGKIDPHDVPQGKNIGIVNTKTSISRIKDGIIYTPYLKLIMKNGRKYLDNSLSRVVWLSAEDEVNHIIGDRESLKVKPSGEIEDGLVIARVPAKWSKDEKQEVLQVSTQQLEYVNATGTYILSPGVQTIPFANSDDPVRINFGSSLILNSIYVLYGERPYVITSMYKDMYKYDNGFDPLQDSQDSYMYCNEFVIRAKDDGYIVAIYPDKLVVKYDSLPTNTSYTISGTKILNSCVISMSFKKGVSERFKKGEVLADTPVSNDGYYSPGVNVLLAYLCWDGYNYEDAVGMIKATAYKFTSVGTHKITREMSAKDELIPTGAHLNKYVPKNGVIDTLTIRSRSNKDLSRKVTWRSGEESGILYDVSTEYSQPGDLTSRVMVAKLLTLRKLTRGDKVAGRHGNKGTDAILEDNSKMATFYNGYVVEVVQDPLGVVSRMNPGQLKEAPLGFVGFLLGVPICSNSYNGASLDDIHYLTKFVYEIANTPIEDEYINSFYKNNSRILIGITKQAKEVAMDIANCERYINDHRGCLNGAATTDIGKLAEQVEASIDRNEEMDALQTLLTTAVTSINTTMDNFQDGINELVQLLSKSSESQHKQFVRRYHEIDNQTESSLAYKNIQKLSSLLEFLKGIVDESFRGVENRFNFPKEIIDVAKSRFWFIKEWENCFFSDGTALLYNPMTGMPFEGHVSIGVPYYLKIVQEADEKTGARGGMLTERYTALEHQPPKGASRGGGQRTGEMELAALQAFGASNLIRGIYNICSDNDGERIKDLCELCGIDSSFISDDQCHPRTVDLFRYILEGMGIHLDISNFPDIDINTVKNYKKLKDISKVVYAHKKHNHGNKEKETREVDSEILKGLSELD